MRSPLTRGGWLLFSRQISIQGSGTWTLIKILKLLGPWSQWEILKRTPSSGDEAPETNFPYTQWPGHTVQCYQVPGKHFTFTISSQFKLFNLVIRNTIPPLAISLNGQQQQVLYQYLKRVPLFLLKMSPFSFVFIFKTTEQCLVWCSIQSQHKFLKNVSLISGFPMKWGWI